MLQNLQKKIVFINFSDIRLQRISKTKLSAKIAKENRIV
jgi:hypothetical protein